MAKRFGNTKKLWIFWGFMYGICAVCSFISKSSDVSYTNFLLMLLAMAFFIPPALLLAYSVKKKRNKPIKMVRNLSIASLALTTVMFILTVATANAGVLGQVSECVLAFVSVPMACSPIPLVGIFGWACLLMASLNYLTPGKTKNRYFPRRRKRT